MNEWTLWERRLRLFQEAVAKIGGEARGYVLKPAARTDEVERIERRLGQRLPRSLVQAATAFAGGIDLSWSLPDRPASSPPDQLRSLFACHCSWDLDSIPRLEEERLSWVEGVFSNPDDPYDQVWHNKLAFMEVGDGDCFAFDLSVPVDPPVVYLAHDGSEGHGYRLGDNFLDFFDKWTMIGCVGCEISQLLPFMKDARSGIDPHADNARLWRSWLQVAIEGS